MPYIVVSRFEVSAGDESADPPPRCLQCHCAKCLETYFEFAEHTRRLARRRRRRARALPPSSRARLGSVNHFTVKLIEQPEHISHDHQAAAAAASNAVPRIDSQIDNRVSMRRTCYTVIPTNDAGVRSRDYRRESCESIMPIAAFIITTAPTQYLPRIVLGVKRSGRSGPRSLSADELARLADWLAGW